MKIIIAGGGIGGLTAALCLQHTGHEVVIVEKSGEPGDIGAGIQISPNGMKVLGALGLAEALLRRGFEPECLELRIGRSGRQVFSIPVREHARSRWGAPYVHVHRADLIATLATAVSERLPGALRTGTAVAGYEQSFRHIGVNLRDGTTLEGDLLVGADGIHSTIRGQMLAPEKPRFTGNVAWRATVAMDKLGDHVPPPTACVWAGPGRHAVTYRLRGGQLANFVGVIEQDSWQTESWTERGTREQVMADFAGWHPVITTLIENADEHFRWALFDRPPLSKWNDRRAVLLGDACHPVLPFLAQGAAMAIEDAWVLSRALAGGAEIEAALGIYYNTRYARTRRVQAGALANMHTFHQRYRLKQIAVYAPMWLAGKMLPGAVHARQDWLYGYDILNA